MGGDGALHIIDYADSKGYVGGGSCDGGGKSAPRRLVQSAGCPGGNVDVGVEVRQFLRPRQVTSSEARKSGRVHRMDASDKSRGITARMGNAGTAGKTGTKVKGHSVLLRRVALCSDDSDGEEFETCGGGGRHRVKSRRNDLLGAVTAPHSVCSVMRDHEPGGTIDGRRHRAQFGDFNADVVSQEMSDVHLERGGKRLKENTCARSAVVRSAPKASDICRTASRRDDALEQESLFVNKSAFQDEPQGQNDPVVSKKTR